MSETSRYIVAPNTESQGIHGGELDKVMSQAKQLEELLHQIFPLECYSQPAPGTATGATVINALTCDERVLIDQPPSGTAREMLENQANQIVQNGSPVAIVGIYGTPRSLSNPWVNRANLSDLSALMLVQNTLQRVAQVYPEGAFYQSLDEDLTALWLEINQQPNGKNRQIEFKKIYQNYFQERQQLIETLAKFGLINSDRTLIQLIKESQVFEKLWADQQLGEGSAENLFIVECEKVKPILSAYLLASNAVITKYYGPEENWSQEINPTDVQKYQAEISALPEYKNLAQISWSGNIPPKMRSYYYHKFRTIIGNQELGINDPLLVEHLATYLASTLIRNTHKTLTYNLGVDMPVIKMPLVKPVDDRPLSHLALIPQRTLPHFKTGSLKNKVSSTNASPWSCLAGFNNDKLRLVRCGELSDQDLEKVIPADVYIRSANGPVYLAQTALQLCRTQ